MHITPLLCSWITPAGLVGRAVARHLGGLLLLLGTISVSARTLTPPADATYSAGQTLVFQVGYPGNGQAVFVNGAPTLAVTIGSNVREAAFAGYTGSFAHTLVFAYTLRDDDSDTDGIVVAREIRLNGGSLLYTDGTAAPTTLLENTFAGNTVQASASAIAYPDLRVGGPARVAPRILNTAHVLRPGQPFTGRIMATDSPSGYAASGLPPGITVDAATGALSGTAGAEGFWFVELSASNAFGTSTRSVGFHVRPFVTPPPVTRGTVIATVGVPFAYPIIFEERSVRITATATGLPPGLSVDADTALITGTPTASGNYNVTVDVAYEDGSERTIVPLTVQGLIPGAPVIAPPPENMYQIVASNGPTSFSAQDVPSWLAFDPSTGRFTVAGPLPSRRTRLPAAVTAGNAAGSTTTSVTFTATSNTPLNDSYITDVAYPASGDYATGQAISINVTYATSGGVGPVYVQGSPRIPLQIGNNIRYATHVPVDRATTHTFRYTITADDSDADGMMFGRTIDLNGGRMFVVQPTGMPGGVGGGILFPRSTAAGPIRVNAGSSPPASRPVEVILPAAGIYQPGSTLAVGVRFSNGRLSMRRNSAGQYPRLPIQIGGNLRYAGGGWVTGTNWDVLAFVYVVQPDDVGNGVSIGDAIDLNGGSIQLWEDTGPVSTSLVQPEIPAAARQASSARVDNAQLTGAPPLLSGTITGTSGNNYSFVHSILAGGHPASVTADIGSEFRFGDAGTIWSVGRIPPGTYNITLRASNAYGERTAPARVVMLEPPSLRLSAAGDAGSVLTPADGTYSSGQSLWFAITYPDSAVLGTPRLALQIGSNTRYATFEPSYAPRALVFRYVVAPDDADADGIEVSPGLEHFPGGLITASAPSGPPPRNGWSWIAPNTSGIRIGSTPPPAIPPEITGSLSGIVQAGAIFEYRITTSGGVPTSFTASGLPAWLALNGTTGEVR